MGGKREKNRCVMLPKIRIATVCRLKKVLKRKVCRLNRNEGSTTYCNSLIIMSPILWVIFISY